MLIENSTMSEAGASKTPSGGYELYMYSRVYRLAHCCMVVALCFGWNKNPTEAKLNSSDTSLLIRRLGELCPNVFRDKAKNLTKAIINMITKKAKEYIDGLWSMNNWSYSVSRNADYYISTTYLDWFIEEITSISSVQMVFALSTSQKLKGNYLHILIYGENIARFQLASLPKFKNHKIINVKRRQIQKHTLRNVLRHQWLLKEG